MRRLALALVASAALAGCLDTHSGHPDRHPRVRTVSSSDPSATDARAGVLWRQLELGDPPKSTLLGYLKTQPLEYGELHWVYDDTFALVGRISPRGEVHRIELDGRERSEGHFALHHAILKLFGQQRERPIHFTAMPEPRDQ